MALHGREETTAHSGSLAELTAALDLRTRELNESLERQAATAEILQIIRNSPTNTQPVFDAIVRSGLKLFPDAAIFIALPDGNQVRAAAVAEPDPARAEAWRGRFPFPLTREYMHGVAILDGKMLDFPDVADAPADLAVGAQNFLASGYRAVTIMPMMHGDNAIGALSVVRLARGPLSDEQLAVLRTFAAQAVIAIENARLFNELRQRTDDLTEALEQQTATSEVLGVISSSPGELEPVFDTILESATGLCEAHYGALWFCEGDAFRTAAFHGELAAEYLDQWRVGTLFHLGPEVPAARATKSRSPVQIADIKATDAYVRGEPLFVTGVDIAGIRTVLAVPMLKDNESLGLIVIYRKEVRPFTDKQIALVENFAAQAVIAIENARLLNELRQRTDDLSESLEQQTATSEVLKVISGSRGELEPVFNAMLANATRLCAAKFGNLYLSEGDAFRTIAMHNVPPAFAEARGREPLVHPAPGTLLGRLLSSKKTVHVPDVTADQAFVKSEPLFVTAVELGGFRAELGVPMLKDGNIIGAIIIYRQEAGPFTDKQIALVTNFAAQAVIAIENARLLNELRQRTDDLTESLEQQTATSEVLKVISSSPGELEPVFQAMLQNAVRLCEAKFGILNLYDGEAFRHVAMHNVPPAYTAAREGRVIHPPPGGQLDRVVKAKEAVHVEDVRALQPYRDGNPDVRALGDLGGARTMATVPMLKDDELIGAIGIYRQEVRPFSDKQIELLKNFAAQAVIAIENTRLLNELRQRTDDLTESLEQQTATSEVLSIISSSPGELAPVFEAMLSNATRICGARFGLLFLWEGDGLFRVAALHGVSPELAEERRREPVIRVSPSGVTGLSRVAQTKQTAHIADVQAETGYFDERPGFTAPGVAVYGGARTELAVPMLKEGDLVGAFVIYRTEARPFTDRHIELVQNFAAQAVIAIENARLLNELRQRTDDLTESLEQQTATSEVLKVISGSPGELEPVFQALLESTVRLCKATFGTMLLHKDNAFRHVALHNVPKEFVQFCQSSPTIPYGKVASLDQILRTKELLHIADQAVNDPNDPITKFGRARTLLGVPIIKESELIGVMGIYRQEVLPFTDKQIELVENFAAQAVIAIENARLLNELRQRTDDLAESLEQQTATSEVFKIISASPAELQPIFQATIDNATRLCGAKFGAVSLREGDVFRNIANIAMDGVRPTYFEERLQEPIIRPTPGHNLDRLLRTKAVVHIPDLASDVGAAQALFERAGARALLNVPLLKDNDIIGSIMIYREEPGAFSDKQIALVENFAAQAVIAIENARLLNELRQRTDDLTEALEQQTATSEVLRIISTNPGDLQPVFDAILDNASSICDARFGMLQIYDGKVFHVQSMRDVPSAFAEAMRKEPRQAGPATGLGRLVATRQPVHIEDCAAEVAYAERDPMRVQAVELGGVRTSLVVPLLQGDRVLGGLQICRQEVRPFTDKQIALVTNFAAQAVIAIENARLLNELRQRTDDLTESLEQQTATSEVLKVISSSPGDLEPVFQAMLANALRICDAKFGVLHRYHDGVFHTGALVGAPPAYADYLLQRGAWIPVPGLPLYRLLQTKQVISTVDQVSERAEVQPPSVKLAGARSHIAVPMLKDGAVVGAITIYRQEVRPFTDKQIALVENFAAQAVIAIENARLLNELRERTDDLTESLEQQTATSEVLRVISGSPGDLEPVFESMLANAVRICGATFGNLTLCEGDGFRVAALHNAPPLFAEERRRNPVIHPEPGHDLYRLATTKQVVQELDVSKVRAAPALANLAGARTIVNVPMLKDGKLIGAIAIYRQEVRAFTDKQIELVKNFAAQAVIAIENARLLNELRQRTDDLSEALEQQTATSEVLRVIASSPGELAPVFQSMLVNATRLCNAGFGVLFLYENNAIRIGATVGVTDALAEYLRDREGQAPVPGTGIDQVLRTKTPVQSADMAAEESLSSPAVKFGGARSYVAVPLLKEGAAIGALAIYRQQVEPFSASEIALVANFASQAVIAIENVRLLNELRQRTDDLSEALEQQTATSEVLSVISSSPGELKPVFNSMLENAVQICDASFGNLLLYDGGVFRLEALHNPPQAWVAQQQIDPVIPRNTAAPLYRIADTKQVFHLPDIAAVAPDAPIVTIAGARTVLGVPMLKQDQLVGVIAIYRQEVRPFTDKQIELVQNFAAQAVIAIENARLLNELRQRTDDLSEALEQQTATSEVLGVISSSPDDLAPVFQTILDNATRLCAAQLGNLVLYDGHVFRVAALHGATPAWRDFRQRDPVIQLGPKHPFHRLLATKELSHFADLTEQETYTDGEPATVDFVEKTGVRTFLAVPMLKDNELIGIIAIYRQEVRRFSDKQIELVENFAAQAVIAIENARLLNELRQRTDELVRSVNELRGLSEVTQAVSSSLDLQTVLTTIVSTAVQLSGTEAGAIYVADGKGENFELRTTHGMDDALTAALKAQRPDRRTLGIGEAVARRVPVQVADLCEEPSSPIYQLIIDAGFRAVLVVPLISPDRVVGVLVVRRKAPGEFSQATIELMQTFAAQSALAIQNANWYRQIEEKGQELALASQHKSQFLANMSHELRTPLNAILGYAELILDNIYGEAPDKMRAVLERIQTNGKHLLGLINDVLDLSKIEAGQLTLTLADYSLKDLIQSVFVAVEPLAAQKQLALRTELQPDLPVARGDDRRLAQVLLNLVGNAIKFTETGEVVIRAAASDGTFDVAVCDTGPGIASADQAKIFEEFQQADTSSTRKKGGTGLGLSISKRIIEMHGGRITVESEVGRGSTFHMRFPVRVERQAGLA